MKSLDVPIVITPTLTLPHHRGRGNPGLPHETWCSVSEKGVQYRHSGLDPESSVLSLDSRFRGNDKSQIIVKAYRRHHTSYINK